MFTLRKWEALPRKTRLRKLVLLLQGAEEELMRGRRPDFPFFTSLFESRVWAEDTESELEAYINPLRAAIRETPESPQRLFNNLRHAILRMLESEPAEWDFPEFHEARLGKRRSTIRPISVYLEDIRSPYRNVGAIFRTAEAFGVKEILISPSTPLPTHPRAAKTSRGCSDVIPWKIAELSRLENRQGLFALETGGTPLDEFIFPREGGMVLVGSEELGLSPAALQMADSKGGRVSIPMGGSKRSLNVAVAFGILIWKWSSFVASKIKT